MAISQIVDDQIKQLRKERAELDELRASLERKQEELLLREQTQIDDVGSSGDLKESLQKEVENLTSEVKRLRAERENSIESFGSEISKVHAEKTAESETEVKQLQGEIAFLLKGKEELEDEMKRLNEKIFDLDKKAKRDLERILEEKEAYLAQIRAERETSLKEINHTHSITMAELDRKKKDLENEISEQEQAKVIEWNRVQAEISRHRTSQLAELNAQREQFLLEFEREKEDLANDLRSKERKQLSEIVAERREWEKEMLKFQSEKQKLIDETKLLEYDYEKMKTENILKIEKVRADDEKNLQAKRAEALIALEEEQTVVESEFKIQAAERKRVHMEEVGDMEKEINSLNVKKSAILSEINTLEVKFEQTRVENEVAIEKLKLEKMKDIDELRISRIREIEDLRKECVEKLEMSFLEKTSELEQAREERLEECRNDIRVAEDRFNSILKAQADAENKIEALHKEAFKIKLENEALFKSEKLEKQVELERMSDEMLAEIEETCDRRVQAANERVQKIDEIGKAREEKLAEEIAEGTETLLEIRRLITAQKLEMEQEKASKLEEIESLAVAAAEKNTKMQMEKISEIERELETYKKERMKSILEDIERQSKASYKQMDELATLNDDYNKRMMELQERSLTVEAEMRVIEFKNKQIKILHERNLGMIKLLAKYKNVDMPNSENETETAKENEPVTEDETETTTEIKTEEDSSDEN